MENAGKLLNQSKTAKYKRTIFIATNVKQDTISIYIKPNAIQLQIKKTIADFMELFSADLVCKDIKITLTITMRL